MSRGEKIAGPEQKDGMAKGGDPEHSTHGHSAHATIHKHGPGHFTVEHEHGESGPHHTFHEAAKSAGDAMGEQMTSEPESGEEVPMENALGMVKDGMSGDD
jgi:hypothetical protein